MLLETVQIVLDRIQPLKDYFDAFFFAMSSGERKMHEERGQVDLEYKEDQEMCPVQPEEDSPIISADIGQVGGMYGQDRLPVVHDDGTGTFRFAHDFVIHNATIISQIIHAGDIGLKILGEKRMIGAEVDSSARQYAPRCHPQTRKSLRNRVIAWIEQSGNSDQTDDESERARRMLWILGPAGVGKSAVAQTIADEMKGEGRLGASLFFSRPNGRDDPEQVIPTLAHQLAVKHPKYKPLLNQKLADDPTLLEKTLRVQFKELIIAPFHTLMTRDSSTVRKPLLIVIDGLDECRSEEAQCEFIELITEHVRSVHRFPLLWLVRSRPEWHFRYLLSRPDFPATCRREHMTIDDPEARQDVALFLRDEFARIHWVFFEYLPPTWPPTDAFHLIILKASGLFALAAIVIRFIVDRIADDPNGQLLICLDALSGSPLAGTKNPLAALDLLYQEICCRISAPTFHTTKSILGVCAFYSDPTPLTARHLANFLGLDQAEFYRSLKNLHSVLAIPSATDSLSTPVRFYHASFQEFLREPRRSGQYTVNEDAVHYHIAVKALDWQINQSECFSRGLSKWASKEDLSALLGPINAFSNPAGLKACSRVMNQHARRELVEMLKKFNFRTLVFDVDVLPKFLMWLHSTGPEAQTILHVGVFGCPPHHSIPTLFPPRTSDDLEHCRRQVFGAHDYLSRVHLGMEGRMCEISLVPGFSNLDTTWEDFVLGLQAVDAIDATPAGEESTVDIG